MTGQWKQVQVKEAESQTFKAIDPDEFAKDVVRWLMSIGKIPAEKSININGKQLEL